MPLEDSEHGSDIILISKNMEITVSTLTFCEQKLETIGGMQVGYNNGRD